MQLSRFGPILKPSPWFFQDQILEKSSLPRMTLHEVLKYILVCHSMKKKVLIAEDDKAIIEVVKIILENEGYEVLTADQGEIVHKTIAQHNPDVILLDIWLYGEDGGQIAKEIKAKTKTKHIPIVLMSANNETEKITKEVGANDFLLKPFNIDDLLYIVRKYIKS